jgi:nitronate monooxygenase
MVNTAIAEKIDIIFAGAGLPLDLPKYLTPGSQTKLVPIVSSGRAIKIIAKKWIDRFGYTPDAVVVEGPKAGGHLGFKVEQIEDPEFSLEKIIPEVIEEVRAIEAATGKKIPVIAAGGIYTGADILRFIKLGADGVQMGTRFVTTDECDASDTFKNTYIDCKESDIGIIKSPVGMPGRAITNEFLEDVSAGEKKPYACPYHCIVSCDVQNSPYCIARALLNAQKGNMDKGFAFAGSNAFRETEIIPVKQLMDELKTEYSDAVKAEDLTTSEKH